MQSVRFVRNNPAEGAIYTDPNTRESYVLRNGYVHNVNVYRKPGQAPVIEVRHTLFPHVRLELESDARALRHFGVDHPGLHKSNPSEYWKKNIQKAIKAHRDRSEYALGDIYSDKEDRDLSGLELSGANMRGANLTFAKLNDANLSDANLSRTSLRLANLTNANLTGANLNDAEISDADLSRANLTGATLQYANLFQADLSNANLTRSDLTKADLTEANLTGADLTGAILTNATLTGAIMPDGTKHR